jgi:Zn-dependent protease
MPDEITDLDNREPLNESMIGRFSKREITELSISIVVMSLAFSFIFADDMLFLLKGNIKPLVISFIVVGTSFVFHEMGHKFMAQRYGMWAEFRMWTGGLMLALFLAIASMGKFVFAAPGAVQIYGYNISPRVNGITSLIGPVINILLGIVFLSGLIVLTIAGAGGFLVELCLYGLIINLWLAAFNMMPVPPFDGHAVMRWNPLIWGVIAVPLFLMMVLFFFL